MRIRRKLIDSFKRFHSSFFSPIISYKIYKKWRRDKRFLPLQPLQYELYDIIHRLCWKNLNKFPDLVSCNDFNDKIQWLKLFDQDELVIQCMDKIHVREYIQLKTNKAYTPIVYKTYDSFKQIIFDDLPTEFVIKTNHDSGTVFIVRDKSVIDKKRIEHIISKSLNKPYGWLKGEWAYSYIEPKIFVEELLETPTNSLPPDYKFHCSNGKVKWLQYIFDRDKTTKEVIIDRFGKITRHHLDHNFEHSSEFVKPSNWELLIEVVEDIASNWKYIRVDAYLIDERIYIGELTFFPQMGCYRGKDQEELGLLINFDTSTYKPFLINYLENKKSRYNHFKYKKIY